ncbi:MAG: cell division protein DivIVA, partial [Jiangellaceae bacterium]
DRLLADARSRAEKIDAETKSKAARIEQDARQRADAVEQEVQQRRGQVFGKLEAEREDLERELETLRAFEREYRSRLKSYLENELRKLEVGGASEAELGIGARDTAPAGGNESSGQSNAGATQTSGSLRSVASLLDDDQH